MALSKLNKKDFDKNYTSDNSYTRTILKSEANPALRLRLLHDIFLEMQADHKLQIYEIQALAEAYTKNHILDIDKGNKNLFNELLHHIHVLDTTKKITETKLLKEWYLGDYLKLTGEIIHHLNDHDKLNVNQINTLIRCILEIWLDDGEELNA